MSSCGTPPRTTGSYDPFGQVDHGRHADRSFNNLAVRKTATVGDAIFAPSLATQYITSESNLVVDVCGNVFVESPNLVVNGDVYGDTAHFLAFDPPLPSLHDNHLYVTPGALTLNETYSMGRATGPGTAQPAGVPLVNNAISALNPRSARLTQLQLAVKLSSAPVANTVLSFQVMQATTNSIATSNFTLAANVEVPMVVGQTFGRVTLPLNPLVNVPVNSLLVGNITNLGPATAPGGNYTATYSLQDA